MTFAQSAVLLILIIIGLAAMLAYTSVWIEPREEDPAPPRDLVDFDEERL